MIITKLTDIKSPPLLFQLPDYINDTECYVKLEGLNISGSIKLKPAISMINTLEKEKKIKPGLSTIICSSSGNLAVAASIVCKERKYKLICVSDPNLSPITKKYIKLYNATLITVSKHDSNGGYLGERIKLIKDLLDANPSYHWLNQYENQNNPNAHENTTAPEILNELNKVDYLFIGSGTTGTLNGCAQYFKIYSPNTKIIAVEPEGSVTFGKLPKKRRIPGLGTSKAPLLANSKIPDQILYISEINTIQRCRHILNKYGLFLGGSSGTVLEGIWQYRHKIEKGSVIVAISPDFGNSYLNTLYDDLWVNDNFSKISYSTY